MKSSIFQPRYILTRLALSSTLLSSIIYGTAALADQSKQTDILPGASVIPSPADLSYAEGRIEEAKTKLEQAQRQFAFAKASVRAAEAELKATKADKQALMLRTAADKLADVSTSPGTVAKPLPPPNSNNMVDLGNTRLQGWDPSSQLERAPSPSLEWQETAPRRQGAPLPSSK